jgi:hypothetical protein
MKYRSVTKVMLIVLTTLFLGSWGGAQNPLSQKWELKSLKKIGGHKLRVFGNPVIVRTDIGKAIKFDGVNDRILVDNNPIGSAKEFTVEVIFKADPAYEISNQPRFVHFQDPEDSLEKRVMVELRLTNDNKWYLDGYIQTDAGNKTLVNRTLTHPLGNWDHVALTFKGNTFTTYVNGVKEISGEVPWKERLVNERGKVSIGGRMNKINYYKGLIKTIRVTHKALDPSEFMKIRD